MKYSPFLDRHDAGARLGDVLRHRSTLLPPIVVLGLARGGVPVAYEVARALHAPLDVFIVRKVGVPGHGEYAMGAIASGGVRVVNDHVMQSLAIPASSYELIAAEETEELERREHAYRDDRPMQSVNGATVVLVDDGIATGASMLAAVHAVRLLGAARIVVATPLVGSDALERLRRVADDVVALDSLDALGSVGAGYIDFTQTSDDEVRDILASPTTVAS